MTRVLILGAGGMLGHKLCHRYRDRFDTWATVRKSPSKYTQYNLLPDNRLVGGVDAFNFDTVVRAIGEVEPDVIINCIGIIKQLPTAKDPYVSIAVNALFPHRLADLCAAANARLVHISTDCVFSGRKGSYTEEDTSDAQDLYGRTKHLGEVRQDHCLTIRTSIIGRELETRAGLVEWFLSNEEGKVRGYTNAIYTGFTTRALADIIARLIEEYPDLAGLYHVSSNPISKYDLLTLIRDTFDLSIEIEPYPDVQIDRSLNSSRFWTTVDFDRPTWPAMIQALATDSTPYETWREERDS